MRNPTVHELQHELRRHIDGPEVLERCWPYFTYGALTLWAVVVLYIWMPETKGRPLEKVAEAFARDGEENTTATITTGSGSGRATPVGGVSQRRRTAMERRGSNV